MRFWRRKVQALTRDGIDAAVADEDWQTFRRSLKGLPTGGKLIKLDAYLTNGPQDDAEAQLRQVRVDNYINALLRGGQLKRICNEMLMVTRK